jgi:hypothetical protein
MSRFNYLLSVTITEHSKEQLLALMNIGGSVHLLAGRLYDSVEKKLLVIYQSKNHLEELAIALEAVPGVIEPRVVNWAEPPATAEIAAARALFLHIGWDTVGISDELLIQYINNALQGKPRLYVDQDPKKLQKGVDRISIKPIEEHPQFSRDWLKGQNRSITPDPDRVFTNDDIVVEKYSVEEIEEGYPPPSPPADLDRRTDAEIKQWCREAISPGLNDASILIERSVTEITITVYVSDQIGTFIYKSKC